MALLQMHVLPSGGCQRTHCTSKIPSLPQCTTAQFNSLASDIKRGLAVGFIYAPTVLRLAAHACIMGSAVARGNGCNGGWLQFAVEAKHPNNAGLESTISWLGELRQTSYPCITYADLYTFAGVLAVEAAGGPAVAWYGTGPNHIGSWLNRVVQLAYAQVGL